MVCGLSPSKSEPELDTIAEEVAERVRERFHRLCARVIPRSSNQLLNRKRRGKKHPPLLSRVETRGGKNLPTAKAPPCNTLKT